MTLTNKHETQTFVVSTTKILDIYKSAIDTQPISEWER